LTRNPAHNWPARDAHGAISIAAQRLASGFQRQRGIVRIARRTAAEKRLAIRDVQRCVRSQALNEVGVGDIQPPEGDEVGEITAARLESELQIVAVIRHVDALERPSQVLQVDTARDLARSLGCPFDDVDVGKIEPVQAFDDVAVGCGRVAVEIRAVDTAQGREPYADSLAATLIVR
jgi:hypothetical protein